MRGLNMDVDFVVASLKMVVLVMLMVALLSTGVVLWL